LIQSLCEVRELWSPSSTQIGQFDYFFSAVRSAIKGVAAGAARRYGRPDMNCRYHRSLQALFWIVLAFALTKAFVLPRKMFRIFHWDKAEHFLAFYVLTLLATAAFPRRPLLSIAMALSLLGASIEVVQGFPIVNRDSDFWDWFADTLAILAALLPLAVLSWRAKLNRTT
jgi:hypothetical protein